MKFKAIVLNDQLVLAAVLRNTNEEVHSVVGMMIGGIELLQILPEFEMLRRGGLPYPTQTSPVGILGLPSGLPLQILDGALQGALDPVGNRSPLPLSRLLDGFAQGRRYPNLYRRRARAASGCCQPTPSGYIVRHLRRIAEWEVTKMLAALVDLGIVYAGITLGAAVAWAACSINSVA